MRVRSALAAVPLLTALACADAPSPTASSADAAASMQSTGGDVCLPPVAVNAITTTYPSSLRGATLRRFQRARARAVQEGAEAAWPEFLALAADAIARESAGTLRDPLGPLTAADAVTLLVDQLFLCGGRERVGEVIGPALKTGVDVAITAVGPNRPTQLVVPSANFGVVDEAGVFFDEHALLVIERVPDDPPFVPRTYTEYPPRYRAHVLPASAQANYGRTPVPGDPTILVVICPADPHPEFDDLTVLRIPDAFPAEPAEPLDGREVHGYGVTCTEAGEYPAPRIGAPSIGGRMFGALRRGAATAFGWLAPEPLYAVDGGIGGRTRLMSAFVAIARPEGETQPGDVVVLNDVNVLDDYGLQNADNRRLARNLVSLGDGPRASATRVIFDRGRDAPCFVLLREACQDAKQTRLVAELADLGLSITKHDDVRSYAEVPADVRAIFLYNPRVAFTAADVAGLRAFVQEGGRIVLLGEHAAFYGPVGLQVENDLLAGLGSGLRAVAAQIDCAQVALPASSILAHQTTSGVASLNVACMGAVAPAAGDVETLRSVDGTRIVGGVTRLGPAAAAGAVAHRAEAAAPSARRQRASPAAAPRLDSRGMPVGTRR